jgi:hypothetical protein
MTPEECIGLSTCCNHVVLTEHLILYGDPRLLADLALLYGYEESFYVRDSAVEGIVDELLADLARALGAKGSRR